MESFEGTVRMPGDPFQLSVVLRIADGHLRVSAHEHELGSWALENVSAQLRPDGCHILVEGEELIATVPHPVRLAEAIGIDWSDPRHDPLTEPASAASVGDAAEVDDEPTRRVPTSWKVAAAIAMAVIGLWIFLPIVLVGLWLVVGAGLLLAGTLAAVDPFTSVRLPERLTPARLLSAGAVFVALALALAIVAA